MNFWNFFLCVFDTLAYPKPGKSTKCQFLLIRKWLMSWVFPGLEDVFARFFLLQIAFINEDLPTLDLPINAYSGIAMLGHF